ncbi:MAG: DUF2141 domain-containing protein [Aeromicrobium sp.]|nr:DUF2141 domain-containing protein [Burkholderiales bacterium]
MSKLPQAQSPIFRSLAVAAFCISSAFASSANAGNLTIDIKGVGDKGNVKVALYKQTDKWMRQASGGGQTVPAKKDGVSVTFEDVPDGEYAVSLFVDENGNGKLDSNAIGIPIEPYAFSNDATGAFGPPTFEQSKFVVTKDAKTIVINIK